jgi:hemoglobin-like flavoprotein
LNPENEAIVRETWNRLKPLSDDVVAVFYARLFESNPAAAKLFESTNMVEQRRKFSAMLNEIVRVLNEPDLLVSEVAASGRRHVQYGVKDRDYEDVGAALVWAICHSLPDCTPEVQAAWREAYALLAAVMRRAAAR